MESITVEDLQQAAGIFRTTNMTIGVLQSPPAEEAEE